VGGVAQPRDGQVTDALTQGALQAHTAGRLDEAERLYQDAIAADPANWLALTNLATVRLQTGRLEQGVEGLRASLRIAPGQPTALNNLGRALAMLGRTDEAIAAQREAAALKPGYVEALTDLGNLLSQAGRNAEAAEAFGAAADADPSSGRLRHAQGLVLHRLGRKAEALAVLERAAPLAPDLPELHNDLGVFRHDNGRAEEALAAFDRALELRPDYAEALSNRARAMHHLGRLDEALDNLDRAVALAPDYAIAFTHRGDVLSALGRFEEALACHDRALELEPDNADAWVRRGDALGFLRRMEEAVLAYDRALTLDPANIKAPFNLAAGLIREGEYEDGWRLYEHRWRDTGEGARPELPGRQWLGEEDVAGKTVVLYSEQGQGDTIMMLRYAPLLARRGAEVILSVQPSLERLAARVEGVSAVAPQGQPLPPFDLHTPLMSLPLAFGTTIDTIPGEPYLTAPPEDFARWAERLGPRKRSRIGLAWAGNPTHNEDRWRSVPLAALASLASLDVDLYAVTLDIREADRAAMDQMGVIPLGPELTDYAATAGLIANLDLVISVDTSLAHLAGAMGRKGLLLLAAAPDYRWGWDGATTPWYPSLRLFRQQRIGDWSGVAEAVRAAASSA
jgi:tetratricopeptide (TPR) repeat protein